MSAAATIENRTFAELKIGETAEETRAISPRHAELLAALCGSSGNYPWADLLLVALVSGRLPGPGSQILSLNLRLSQPLGPGGAATARVRVLEKIAPDTVRLECEVRDPSDTLLADGTLLVRAPSKKICAPCGEIPAVPVNDHVRYQRLIERCAPLAPALTAVVHPCDAQSLNAAVEAEAAGLITPVLVGPEKKIRAVAAAAGLDIGKYRLVPTPHSHAAAAEAVALVRRGEAEILMKGSLHTDELMHEVMRDDTGLRTGRRISHVYLFDIPVYPRPLLITDAAINISPTLSDKRDICQNAIDLARVMGIENPKVAILSAVETVSDKLPSTLDAAALCKMADRGQITGGLLDGPLAFDNAVSLEAARTKGIVSAVAGQADILLVPDLESGNMLAKQLTFFGGADGAGIVLGARLPIILTSRADPLRTRIASCAIALLMAEARRHPAPAP